MNHYKLSLAILVILFQSLLQSNPPAGFNYQAILKDESGNVLVNTSISLQAQILQSSLEDKIVYEETHSATTNQHGAVNLVIGTGNVSQGSTLDSLLWNKGPFIIKMFISTDEGSTWKSIGKSQLWSVPYAMYGGNSTPGPQGEKGEKGEPGEDGAGIPQTLSKSGDTLKLSDGGGFVVLPKVSPNNYNGNRPIDADSKNTEKVTTSTGTWVNLLTLQIVAGGKGTVALTGDAQVRCGNCAAGTFTTTQCDLGWATYDEGIPQNYARALTDWRDGWSIAVSMGINDAKSVPTGNGYFYFLRGRSVSGKTCVFTNYSGVAIFQPN